MSEPTPIERPTPAEPEVITIWLMKWDNTPIKEITEPGGLCRVLSESNGSYILANRIGGTLPHFTHTERRPRNANCFVRRHLRRGK